MNHNDEIRLLNHPAARVRAAAANAKRLRAEFWGVAFRAAGKGMVQAILGPMKIIGRRLDKMPRTAASAVTEKTSLVCASNKEA